MKQTIILDTNFIVTCVKQKIQLFEQLDEVFVIYNLVVAKQIIDELEKIKNDKETRIKEREAAQVSILLLKKKAKKLTDFKTPNVDAGILRYIKGKEDIIVATLDRDLIAKIKRANKKAEFLTIKQKTRIRKK